MNIIYIATVCSPKMKEKIKKTQIIKQHEVRFSDLIINGLIKNDTDVTIISGIPVTYKTNSKKIWKTYIEEGKNKRYINVSCINFPVIRTISTARSILKVLKNELKNNKLSYIIIDSSFVSVIPQIMRLRKKYNFKIIGLTADIYDYMWDVDNNTEKNKIVSKIYRKIMKKIYPDFDGFIFLTEAMNSLMNIKKKPYIIMEGLVDSELIKNEKENVEKVSHKKIVLYAGWMLEKYGVKRLIDAFKLINNKYVELHLYGEGELEEYINSIKDERIKYCGVVSHEVILEKEKEATLLVNPRFSDAEYTKYSFPSKNMEYMYSGTPLLTTKLPGMPNEYIDYIYCFNEESVEEMKKTLEEVISKPEKELIEKGKKAQKFVQEQKNNIIQSKRIIDLLKEL